MNFEPIGIIHNGYKEKFGIPRQPGLATSMVSTIELLSEYSQEEVVRGLEGCSHIWLIFIFSACVDKGWSPTVRPPRFGGNQRMGVLATRSPFRPNPIGLSAVKLEKIETDSGKVVLTVSGADLLDQTPVLDIKPYIPYSDSLTDAHCHYAQGYDPLSLPVKFTPESLRFCEQVEKQSGLVLIKQIIEILQCDPRPAYQRSAEREYGIRLHDYNIRWSIDDKEAIHVLAVEECES